MNCRMWAYAQEIPDGEVLLQKNDIQNAALRQTINITHFHFLAQWHCPDAQQYIFAEETILIIAWQQPQTSLAVSGVQTWSELVPLSRTRETCLCLYWDFDLEYQIICGTDTLLIALKFQTEPYHFRIQFKQLRDLSGIVVFVPYSFSLSLSPGEWWYLV